MAEKPSVFKTSDSSAVEKSKEYDASSGKSPLEWLEINEGIRYSSLEKISGERRLAKQMLENPVVLIGLLSSGVAIGGGLYSIRSENSRLSNHFLKLRWGSSSIVFGYVVYKIWDKIDWNPPGIKQLHGYIAQSFKKDTGMISEEAAAKVE